MEIHKYFLKLWSGEKKLFLTDNKCIRTIPLYFVCQGNNENLRKLIHSVLYHCELHFLHTGCHTKFCATLLKLVQFFTCVGFIFLMLYLPTFGKTLTLCESYTNVHAQHSINCFWRCSYKTDMLLKQVLMKQGYIQCNLNNSKCSIFQSTFEAPIIYINKHISPSLIQTKCAHPTEFSWFYCSLERLYLYL